jgi:hypothetical protein
MLYGIFISDASQLKRSVMRTPGKIVSILSPCQEDWNKMTPGGHGRFCGSCQKTVVDFTNKTDLEISNYIESRKGESLCGHFKKSQVDRPLVVTVDLKDLPRFSQPARMFVVALFLAFGTTLFSCQDHHNKKIDTIQVKKYDSDKSDETTGKVRATDIADQTVSQQQTPPPPIFFDELLMLGEVVTFPVPEEDSASIKEECFIVDSSATPAVPHQKNNEDQISDDGAKEQNIRGMISTGKGSYTVAGTRVSDSATEVNVPDRSAEVRLNAIDDEQQVLFASGFDVYPNPASSECTISYKVIRTCNVRLEILDENGVLLKTIVDIQGQHTGMYHVSVFLASFPSGAYVVRLTHESGIFSRKLLVSK